MARETGALVFPPIPPEPPPHSLHTRTNHHEPTECKHPSLPFLATSKPSADATHLLYSTTTISDLPLPLPVSIESSYGEALPTKPVPICATPIPPCQLPLCATPPCEPAPINPPPTCPLFPQQMAPVIPMISLTRRLYDDNEAPHRWLADQLDTPPPPTAPHDL